MFEKMNWYMEVVDDDIVLEAIGVEHPEHTIEALINARFWGSALGIRGSLSINHVSIIPTVNDVGK